MPTEPEPTGWELRRQIERLHADLKAAMDRAESHVTETGLAALLGRYQDQLKYLNEDLAEERTMRRADILAEQEARKGAVAEIREAVAEIKADRKTDAGFRRQVLLGISLAVFGSLTSIAVAVISLLAR